MFRRTAGIVGVAVLAGAAPAYAASGSLTRPKGDFPDFVKLSYDNAASKVTMTMTYAGGRPQNESFYMRWGAKDYYQVFVSPSASLKELRYSGGKVRCAGLVIRRPTTRSTTAIIPRSCLPKAPAKLRFQGIGTLGLMNFDETRISTLVGRG